MTADRTRWHGFLLYPNGTIDLLETCEDGVGADTIETFVEPGLYNDLVLAGYPLHGDNQKSLDATLDLAVDPDNPTEVLAYVDGEERWMGAASELFLAWYRTNVAEEN